MSKIASQSEIEWALWVTSDQPKGEGSAFNRKVQPGFFEGIVSKIADIFYNVVRLAVYGTASKINLADRFLSGIETSFKGKRMIATSEVMKRTLLIRRFLEEKQVDQASKLFQRLEEVEQRVAKEREGGKVRFKEDVEVREYSNESECNEPEQEPEPVVDQPCVSLPSLEPAPAASQSKRKPTPLKSSSRRAKIGGARRREGTIHRSRREQLYKSLAPSSSK